MRYVPIVAAALLAVTFTGSATAGIVDVQPPEAYNTVMGTSGWLPVEKVYSLANTSLGWVYWQGAIAGGQADCRPAAGWIPPSGSVNITICPAESMATAEPGTYTDQVTLSFDPRLVGDINGDGFVDVVDLLSFVPTFGTQTGDAGYDPSCDFNADGYVDSVDLLNLVDTFGMTYGSLAV